MANSNFPLVFDFLNDLKENNNRDWFQANKSRYTEAHENVIAFADELLDLMHGHDHLETQTGKKSLHRIYRDVRFSKNKVPYKQHWGGSFRRATAALRGGYYFHIAPEGSFVAGGFWGPNKDDLLRIRKEIAADAQEFREVLANPLIKNTLGEMRGEQLKTAPKGFSKEHPDVDLLRFKQFTFMAEIPQEDVLSPGFAQKANQTFMAFRPFFDYMSSVLTTDENGVSLI